MAVSDIRPARLSGLGIVVHEHREILDIIRSGDVSRATATIEAHAQGAFERMMGTLQPGEPATPDRLSGVHRTVAVRTSRA